MAHFAKEQIKKIRKQVGDNKVICALSGGVDSSVTAALLYEAIGDKLVPIFVDTGLLRKGEKEEVEQNKQRIIQTLQDYGIKIEKIKATIGPTITLYEVVPAKGIKVSKIKNLEDDIALRLAATGIRIIAPMPGRGTIGIEIPNKNPQIVSLKNILATQAFKNMKGELPLAIGRTISNEVFMIDLAKLPHLLIAGATGQGKSVGINCMIASLLYKKHPAEVKFVLIDPKKVEMSLYKRIENHYLAVLPNLDEPIITDVTKVKAVLMSLTKEISIFNISIGRLLI